MKKRSIQFAVALSLCFPFPRLFEGAPGNDNPTGVMGDYNGSITTGGSYDPYTGNAKRFVTDLTVTGSVGAYPLKWTRILNTRDAMSGALGQGGTWRHSYGWGLWVRPYGYHYGGGTYDGPDGSVSYPDGRKMDLWANPDGSYEQASLSAERLDRLEAKGGGNFDLVLKDGGRVEFRRPPWGAPAGHDVIPTAIVDPYGQRTLLGYDALHRLSTITEPAGRYLLITYETKSYPVNWPFPGTHYVDVICRVEAFAGPSYGLASETVHYSYLEENLGPIRYYNLSQVDYADNTHATYTYFPSSASAAGGTSSAVPGRIRTCDDARFAGAMSKIEYEYQECVAPCDVAVGQIKRERNLTTHQVVSEVIYPGYNPYSTDPSMWARTERRPDGATRTFQYSNDGLAELQSYTDFEVHSTSISGFLAGSVPTNYARIVTDARLNTTTTETTRKDGAVMSVKHNNDPPVTYTYSDPNNPWYLKSRTDELQHTTWYDRYPVGDPNANMIQQIRYPDGGSESFTYNNFGQVLTHLMTSGGTETFTYDTRGLKQTYQPPATASDRYPEQHPTVCTYYNGTEDGRLDRIDRLKSVMDPRGHTTAYDYNVRGQLTKTTHPVDSVTGLTYTIINAYNDDDSQRSKVGTLASVTDELNHATRYEYDDYKRVIKVVDASNKETSSNYTPPNGLSPLSHTTASIYHVTSPTNKVTESDYDKNFRRKRTTAAPNTPDTATTSFTYDEAGNLKTVTDPNHQADLKCTTYGYDDRNRQTTVTDALEHQTVTIYDDANNKRSVERADGYKVRFTLYDEMNRLKEQFDERNFPSSMEYDPAGNLTSQKDERGNVYSYAYDKLNRKESMTYPPDDTGDRKHEDYLYDWAGNLFTYTNRTRAVQTFTYDERNRQTRFTWTDGTSWQNTAYDAASRVRQITNAFSTINYTYYDDNRLQTEEESIASSVFGGIPPRPVTYSYYDDGSPKTIQYPGGDSFTYAYTNRNQLFTGLSA